MGQTSRTKLATGLKAVFAAMLVAETLAVTPGVAGAVTPTDLFMSEYIEGSSFNKAIEIYNGTGAPVDLGAGSYALELYSNGSANPSQTVALAGTIADGDVFVVANGGAGADIQAQTDQTSNAVANFNGDDGVVLRKGGAVVDAFGQNAFDPGSQWPGGGQNDTLQRKDGICAGDTDFSNAFDASIEWNVLPQDTFSGLGAHAATCNGGGGPSDPLINEFVSNHTGADTEAFIEVLGTASTDYSDFTLLEIEGDPTNTGTIDAVLPVGTTDANGYWVDDEDMENGSVTILLVEGFTGSNGDDLDTDDDGVLDATPWSRIVDDVATTDGGGNDLVYSSTVLGPFFDGNPFGAGGASRIPNGTDTDSNADWTRNDFGGWGFPGFPGDPDLGEAVNTPGATNEIVTVATDPVGACFDDATLIHDIQGSGAASADVGSIREIEGVVVGLFQGAGTLGGFNVQEEDGDADGNPVTSEGIFVFEPNAPATLAIGDVVRVRGSVTEFGGLTEINNVDTVLECGVTGTATPASMILPIASLDDYEAVEGMAVSFPQQLFVSGNFTQARFGEVDLAVDGPLDNPTNVVEPGAAANALQDANNLARIQLDDGRTAQNATPPAYFDAGTLRTGDSVTGLAAVMGFSFGNYELHPTAAVPFVSTNPRPGVPDVGGRIQVAAYNVLNYFTTVDDSGPICGPNGDQGCRGADTDSEFTRQRDKIISAIIKLDADVVGLMEIENHIADDAVADLVAGLNAATAPGTYAAIETGAIGSDAIKVALLYQPDAVTPVGDFAILDSSVDPRFNDERNRPMLTQSFTENSTGAVFTTSVNHLKSKGSDCDDLGDPDMGDGQGNCNLTRTSAAQAIVDWLATDPTGSGDGDHLIIGDLNAYAKEDPIDAIKAGGYTDLIQSFVGEGVADGAYSFNFFSQSGYLDHGLASPDIVSQVTGADFWHINADEPSGLDYNNFNQPSLYSPDEFRSSDHDPVVIGLDLDTPMSLKTDTIDALSAIPPTGNNDDTFIAKAIERVEQSLEEAWWIDSATLDPDNGNRVFDREHQAVKELEKVSSVDVQGAIDNLVEADRLLARNQLDAAIAAGGNASTIAKAEGNMADAAQHVADGDYAKAVLDYKKAWQNAVKAL